MRGRWLLRIDDVDTSRCRTHFTNSILDCLTAHGLHWDDAPLFQSVRSVSYQEAIDQLASKQLCYTCTCSRQEIKGKGQFYTGTCKTKQLSNTAGAIRLHNHNDNHVFHDQHFGKITINPLLASEDIVLRRKDGVFAYHLATVIDDIAQGVTHIVRGADLLECAAVQNHLFALFSRPSPQYLHIPVLSTSKNMKLSKQNHAPAIDSKSANLNIVMALKYLGIDTPNSLKNAKIDDLLLFAIERWHTKHLGKNREVLISA